MVERILARWIDKKWTLRRFDLVECREKRRAVSDNGKPLLSERFTPFAYQQ